MAASAVPAAAASALATDQIGTIAVVVIVAIVVIGLVLSLVMNKAIGRVVLAIIVIGLGVLVWTQRQSLQDRVDKCDTNTSFFGFHVNLSAAAQQRCASLNR
jgi:protein-S-isoprenylcysteine O-methyltransferase Ste14